MNPSIKYFEKVPELEILLHKIRLKLLISRITSNAEAHLPVLC